MNGSSEEDIIVQSLEKRIEKRADSQWKRLSDWICCMAVVTFDLNLGQALEFVYPSENIPTEKEITNICYMAFPDSNSGCMGDTKFHIRLRMAPDVYRKTTISENLCIFNSDCVPLLRADPSHYWGFVYFRQKKDVALPRGYFQKSFIVITKMPFFNLFYDIVEEIAPKYFETGNSILIDACEQIEKQWPKLQAGITLNLMLFELNYQMFIPRASNRKAIGTQDILTLPTNELKLRRTKVLASVNELELFQSLGFVIENMYTLWELVLTSEPIVVVGTSPADCSHMVQTLVALIAPLEYFGEARPYFTIHDSEFKEFTRESGKAPPSVILGVTNPFFIKLLKNWPHILRLVDNQVSIQQPMFPNKSSNSVTSLTNSYKSHFIKKRFSSHASLPQTATTSNSLSGDGTTPGLYTKYKPFVKKDKAFIKKVLLGMKTKRPIHVQTALLRRNLVELTHSFMIPLERYVASLMPLQKDISPFKSAPDANIFHLDDFLATLEHSGPHLTSPLKGDWRGLYKRFFHSPNFRGWYETRHRELQLTLQELQLQALSEANLKHWAQEKQEVEIIDMILKLKQKLNLYTEKAPKGSGSQWGNGKSATTREQIRAQIHCMKEMLPNDLKNIVNI